MLARSRLVLCAAVAAAATSAPPPIQPPRSISGVVYGQRHAAMLNAVTAERRYTSAVWLTKIAAEKLGLGISDAALPVELPDASGHPALVYNACQTSAPAVVEAASANHGKVFVPDAVRYPDAPLRVTGRALQGEQAAALNEHAKRHNLSNRYWVTKADAERFGVGILPAAESVTLRTTDAKGEEFSFDVFNAQQTTNDALFNDTNCRRRSAFKLDGAKFSLSFTNRLHAFSVRTGLPSTCGPYWATARAFEKQCGVSVKSDAEPFVTILPDGTPYQLFNVGQTTDPEAVRRSVAQQRKVRAQESPLCTPAAA